jgi:tryptophan halogenase
MTGIIRLMRLFPFQGITDSIIDEYNIKLDSELNSIRDFIIMHYKVNNRQQGAFWDYCKDMDIPDSLAHKLALFRESGRVFLDDGDIFRVDSWTQVLLGQGMMPKQYHQITAEMSDGELTTFMSDLKQAVNAAVAKLPSHQQFINQHCKASA